jgi:micrococcal nuclease
LWLLAPMRLKNTKLLLVLGFLAVFLVGGAGGYAVGYSRVSSEYEQALVVKVIDGDTVELFDGRRVRYLGIDTPETDEPYFAEATARNRELVEGKIVELQSGAEDRDVYDRLLRYVYVDGVFVNAELVAEGYATAYIFDPDGRFSQVLVQLEQYAKLRGQGIWS